MFNLHHVYISAYRLSIFNQFLKHKQKPIIKAYFHYLYHKHLFLLISTYNCKNVILCTIRSKVGRYFSGVENCIIAHAVHLDFETATGAITWLPVAVGIISLILVLITDSDQSLQNTHLFKIKNSSLLRFQWHLWLLRRSCRNTSGMNWYPQFYKNSEGFEAVSIQSYPNWETGYNRAPSVTSCRDIYIYICLYVWKIIRLYEWGSLSNACVKRVSKHILLTSLSFWSSHSVSTIAAVDKDVKGHGSYWFQRYNFVQLFCVM